MKKLKLLLLPLLISVVLLPAVPADAFDPLFDACNDLNNSANSSEVCNEAAAQGDTNPITGSEGIASKIGRILSVLVGIAAVIMLMLGGLNLITAGGNAEQEAKGRRRVIYAIIGLAVAALAWTLITFVLDRLL